MLWLERPPVLRWSGAALLFVAALWLEFAPSPSTTLVFLAEDIAAGTTLTEEMVERRVVAGPGFDTVDPSGVAAVDLAAGEPLIRSMLAEITIPAGWLVIGAPLPDHAAPGAEATGIILPADASGTPTEFPALVVEVGSGDPFESGAGALAVPPEWLARAAGAAGEGRLMIGVEAAAR